MSCDERSSAEEDQWNPHRRGMDAAEQRPLLQPVRVRNSSSTGSDDANYFPEDPEYSSIVRAIEIAIESEVYPEIISQGSSGSYFAKKKNGDIVGVFKPRNEEPYAMMNPKWTKWLQKKCCPCCFGRGCLLSNVGYLSEAGASIVDDHLGLGIVPKTKVVWLSAESFNYSALERAEAKTKRQLIHRFPQKLGKRLKAGLPQKVGSLQLFVKGYVSASQMLRRFEENPLPTTVDEQFQKEFEKLVILDYIIRNTGNTEVFDNSCILFASCSKHELMFDMCCDVNR
jgi:phosphatidylinositol 4-kinase type 2